MWDPHKTHVGNTWEPCGPQWGPAAKSHMSPP